MTNSTHAASVGPMVNAFYEQLPFNFESNIGEQAETVRRHNQIAVYHPVDAVLRHDNIEQCLDLGSGSGWFANSVAYWYGKKSWGVDFTSKTLDRAAACAAALGITASTKYVHSDLFCLPNEVTTTRFDFVNSLGVLHHTKNCREAFQIAASLTKPGGYIHVGLYHRYGRRPLLDYFEPIRRAASSAQNEMEKYQSERAGFERWKTLHRASDDETFLLSWYRDQCLHPYETQHTLAELLGWFEDCDITPLSTSLDRYSNDPNWNTLVADEPRQEEIAKRKLRERNYFPGFFTLFGVRNK